MTRSVTRSFLAQPPPGRGRALGREPQKEPDISKQRTTRCTTMDQAHIRVLVNAVPSVRREAVSV